MRTKRESGFQSCARRMLRWLLYPTLVVTLWSIPTYVELYRSNKLGVSFGQSVAAPKRDHVWKKNLRCTAAPFDWYVNQYSISVDTTICKSGDVLVRVNDPNGKAGYSWVPVDGLIPKSTAVSLLSKAYAAQPVLPLQMAQANDTVICQRFIDSGRILRRIQIRSGCYDEIVNPYTGEVLQLKPAPCDPNC